MKMRASCPFNYQHREFYVEVVVKERWVVDPDGDFIDMKEFIEVVKNPDAGDIWICAKCGAHAEFLDDER